uniref:WW domain-containing protein n=3 Tax=Magallana gigas TaxID=29159 RepID=A0A8W8LM42_MAGGI
MNAAGPPLPPGWEARWDRNQGAYFFIDHSTKKTTWIDPRIAMYQPQQTKQPQQQQYGGQHHSGQQHAAQHQHGGQHAAAAQLLNQSSVNSPSTREIPLDSLNRVDNRDHTPGKDHTTRFSVKHPPPETTDDHLEETIKELVKSCPGAGQQMVKDVLASCDNDKFKAKIALRAMGYTDSAEGSTKRDTTQGRESLTKHTYSTEMSGETTQRDHIPTKHTYTAVPAREKRDTSPQRDHIPTKHTYTATPAREQRNTSPQRDHIPTKHTYTATPAREERDTSPQRDHIPTKHTYTATPAREERDTSPQRDHIPTKHTYTATPAREERDTSPQRDHIPTKHTYTATPAREERHTSPKRETISEDEKKKIKQRVIRAFPELEADVIDIALNICKYKEGECRTLLKGWNEKKKPEMSSRSKTEDSGFSDFSSRPTTSMSTEPVPIDMNAGLPVTLELDPVDTPTPKKGGSPKKKKQTKDRSRTPENRPSSSRTPENRPSSSRTRQQPAPKSAKSSPKQKQTQVPVTREQHFARSEYRTMAVGPNSELRNGPDESLLITDRLVAMGPNPDLQQGPDESRLGERTVAVGPNPDLVQGPMFQASPTRLIISAV